MKTTCSIWGILIFIFTLVTERVEYMRACTSFCFAYMSDTDENVETDQGKVKSYGSVVTDGAVGTHSEVRVPKHPPRKWCHYKITGSYRDVVDSVGPSDFLIKKGKCVYSTTGFRSKSRQKLRFGRTGTHWSEEGIRNDQLRCDLCYDMTLEEIKAQINSKRNFFWKYGQRKIDSATVQQNCFFGKAEHGPC